MNKNHHQLTLRCGVHALFALILIFGLMPPAGAQTQAGNPPPAYLNPSLPLEKRVDDLISRLTLEEKVRQMQHTAPAIPRLGVPSYDWWSEALHGVAFSGYATVFPQAIGMAATWDQNLVHREGATIATEAAPSITRRSAKEIAASTSALISGRPTSTSFAIRAGGAGRKPTAKIPFLPASWAWPS